MQALADGGHQVGALAKLHFPDGKDCTERGTDAAFARTQQWLDAGETVIFEAALKAGHKFIRVDVLELTPNEIRIIEVKAKGLDGDAPGQFFGKRGGIDSGWRPYLEDVAFQVEVARAHFEARGDRRPVRGLLMGPDKNAEATESGLHQHFLIREVDGRNECIVRPGTALGDLGEGLMARADVSRAINDILTDPETYDQPDWACSDFRSAIRWFEELHLQEEQGIDLPMIAPPGTAGTALTTRRTRSPKTARKAAGGAASNTTSGGRTKSSPPRKCGTSTAPNPSGWKRANGWSTTSR